MKKIKNDDTRFVVKVTLKGIEIVMEGLSDKTVLRIVILLIFLFLILFLAP